MSDTAASLVRKIKSAGDLHSVVRTMKAIAASRIAQYENSVLALGDYHRSVELALAACFRDNKYGGKVDASGANTAGTRVHTNIVGAIVFGSDQGLVGQFNQVLAEYTANVLAELPGKLEVWAVGERIHARLAEAGLPMRGLFTVPTSAKAIVPLVGRIQIDSGMQRTDYEEASFFVFHNRPQPGGLYEPVSLRLLPLDAKWQQDFANVRWPNRHLPEVMPANTATLRAFIGEYLFISIFRACAESLASENASRLAAMTRAERNIDELSERLLATFHRLRQGSIDEELFDVVAGYEALAEDTAAHGPSGRAAARPDAGHARAVSPSGVPG